MQYNTTRSITEKWGTTPLERKEGSVAKLEKTFNFLFHHVSVRLAC
ncbi:hypothetical protein [Staphylococcus aureus]|nr:hypothetical protein [Staphylococcus aureus]NGK99349.1 hypothetical protein [Staphylococcus aureus]GBU80734.1 hypothetical protein M1C046_2486 [Staphylococcus aureus]GBV47139.1 hypothetical protein M1K025_2500 [Staphylococcus aureus]GBV49763.1 hypothetical protein M1K027_2499 [Staphylococcus aureus]GBV59972.1 hypothetical protein M1K033_2536 [Staphylococcus aureus]